MPELTISVVIPTYQREKVLIETLEYLLDYAKTTKGLLDLIVVDQTQQHEHKTEQRLSELNDLRAIKWVRLNQPHLTRSMNLGLLKASGDIVLFTDDDIIPNGNLIEEHLATHRTKTDVWAVAGQVLQPGQSPEPIRYTPKDGRLKRYLNFPFWSTEGTYVENVMAGNLSVKRNQALLIGGFDENFTPPVAVRFETEFAKRIISLGGKIWFEPRASIHHLRETTGGTRSQGHDLSSSSPIFGVGDFYFALKLGKGIEKYFYIINRFFGVVSTKFHLKNPWYIPLKFVGECRAFMSAYKLNRKGPEYISKKQVF